MNRQKLISIFFGFLTFSIPFLLYWITHSGSLAFADAGEFALVTRIAGIAHPPGFPAYVVLGWLWGKIALLFSADHIINMVLFSIICMAGSALLLFLTIRKMIREIFFDAPLPGILQDVIACTTALAFATGLTVWHWANNIEVYAFHVLTMALLVYGLVSYYSGKKKQDLILAGIGYGLGLCNHHLTIIVFTPFILFFFRENFFRSFIAGKRPRQKDQQKVSGFYEILTSKSFRTFFISASSIVIVFYGWMIIRAGQEIPFKFGTPDNLSRFFYHLSGGSWQKNTAVQVRGIVGMRLPYFMMLTWTQLFFFLPFALVGLYELFRRKLKLFAISLVLYYLILLFYQLRIDQTSDTDAYMLLPFYFFALAVGIGFYRLCLLYKPAIYLAPLLIAGQVILHFNDSDKRNFNVSESLMAQLDKSAPKKSIILISDWTLVSQFYYYHIAENFRKDLVILNYDLKFTNYRILEMLFPELYQYIKPEYDHFIQLLGKAHPQEIYNTGCTLDSPELMNAFLSTTFKIQRYCLENHYAFMCDPKCYLFLRDNNGISGEVSMSGFFISKTPTNMGKEFLNLPFKWLDSPLELDEPAAVDKIVDFEAALDFSRNQYQQQNDTTDYLLAENAYQKIKDLQKRMKKNMPFVYRAN